METNTQSHSHKEREREREREAELTEVSAGGLPREEHGGLLAGQVAVEPLLLRDALHLQRGGETREIIHTTRNYCAG